MAPMYQAVLVVAFGYFVDIFDLTLLSMLRSPSLSDLGYASTTQIEAGIFLLNTQMAGMLLGGFFWGILGDRKGRLKMLFASILCYSIANLLNGFVQDLNTYAVLRFFSGFGLAGELGVGITLIAEILPQKSRGLGTTTVTAIGVLGAVCSGAFVEFVTWRTAYLVGGALGLVLVLMRFRMQDSPLFTAGQSQPKTGAKNVRWGSLRLLLGSWKLTRKYILSAMLGLPIWCIAGILFVFSPEIARALGVLEPVVASRVIAASYFGVSLGDLTSGLLSQLFKNRIRVIQVFMVLNFLLVAGQLLTAAGNTAGHYYFWAGLVGFGTGYWTLFVTMGAEQFGTNLRATVATTLPNLVRGAVIPMTLIFGFLKSQIGLLPAVQWIVGVVALTCFAGSFFLPDTFAKDLDYFD